MQKKTKQRWTAALAFTACAALALPLSLAHPRPYPHSHRTPKHVIVVGDSTPATRTIVVNGTPRGVLDMNVKPKATRVFVDGRFRGIADQLDGTPGKLYLAAGLHDIRLVTPDGVSVERQVRVRAGEEINVGIDLR